MFNFSSFGDSIALITSAGQQVTYAGLSHLAETIAANVEPHQLVFCLCGNNVGSIAGYAAFLSNGDASLMLDAGMNKESYDSLAATYRPRYIWAPSGCKLVCGARKMLEIEAYVLYDTDDSTPVSEELALLLATSGSTGSPKLVRLSKDNLRSNAAAIIEYLHITSEERPVLGLPMYYAYGLSIINSHLMAGATLLLTEVSFADSTFFQFAIGNGFTSFSGVPYAYETIRKLKIYQRDMPTLRTLTQAGGYLSAGQVRFFDDICRPKGVKFYVMYGQAEATARMGFLEPEYIETKAGSIGKAIPGGRLSLVDDSGEAIESPGVVGEILYEGPNVSLGYSVCREDLLKGDENGGVLHTGDMAYRDEDGFYYIAGRKSRFVKPYGIRISLDHIESLLRPFLPDCACCGDNSGIAVFTTDADCDKKGIVDFLASRTRIIKKTFSVRVVDTLPRNEYGKIMYSELERQRLNVRCCR